MDEMHIREDLVYDKHTGALLGFATTQTGIVQPVGSSLKVVGATFDGASPNRRFVKLHGITQPTNTTVLHKVLNPYADGSWILFFSDPPHLLNPWCQILP